MGEGFGDYFSAAVAKQSVDPPRPALEACMGEWDDARVRGAAGAAAESGAVPAPRRPGPDSRAGRIREPPATRRPHCAGEAWSGALWDIRAQLGAPNADRLVIQSHYSLTLAAGFHEGALALIAADQALFGGAHVAFLRGLLISRGLLDAERLDDTPGDAVPLTVPGSRTGSLGTGSDNDDVYALDLAAGAGVVLRLQRRGGRLRPAPAASGRSGSG